MTRSRFTHAAALAVLALALAGTKVASAQGFRAPVECDSCIGYFYYLDQGFGQDWNCGFSSYDGHTGSDYSLRNNNAGIDGNHEVVAMAPGVVVHVEDGYYDRCRQCGGANCGYGIGNGFGNQVIINHGPYRVIYGHMKLDSISVREGDQVECGQMLGYIGSSGCSTGAHLHIEPSIAEDFRVRPYVAIDPYAGDCSPTESSLFVDQGAYRTMPSSMCEEPEMPACPAGTSATWTCTEDGGARQRCQEGMVSDEPCAFGCTAMPDDGDDDVCALPPDADDDGSRADVDCDDQDPAIHPGAVEVCDDGIDQSCSGSDMECPNPPVGGMGGAPSGPMPTAGSTAPPLAGQPAPGQPGGGMGGQPQPPLGQAGAQAGAASPPLMPPSEGSQSSGCSAAAPGRPAGGSFIGLLLILALWGRSRRRSVGVPSSSG